MPRQSPYTEKQKAAIIDAIKSGRKAGKKWPEIFEDAKAEGFKGGQPYLVTMARAAGAVRRRRVRAGRPKEIKSVAKRRPGRPRSLAVAANGSGLSAIDKIVERMVEQRVGAKIGQAIKALERAAGELKGI